MWRACFLGAAIVASQQWRPCGAAEILHTRDGAYDSGWMPELVTDLDGVAALAAAKDVLIALLDDGHPCSSSFDPIVLRSAQRFELRRFLGIAVARLSTWDESAGAWPGAASLPCEVRFYNRTGSAGALLSPAAAVDASAGASDETYRAVLSMVQRLKEVTDVVFRNDAEVAVDVRWLEADDARDSVRKGERVVIPRLGPGQERVMGRTFKGHTFGFRAADGGGLLGFHTVSRSGEVVTIGADTDGACGLEEALDPHVREKFQERGGELDMELVLREHLYNMDMEKRLALSDTQAARVPSLTEDGFRKDRMPDALRRELEEFLARNYETERTVLESDGGSLYNQRFIPTYHTPLPDGLKRRVFDTLRVSMEAWAGGIPLEGTSCYGVRTYTNGSYLHLHVDTMQTHVISGIINVAQTGVEEPWPLEILDLDGRLHSINMDPGDLVFYESAKLLHGRPHPLRGERYSNVFVHYKPREGWEVVV